MEIVEITRDDVRYITYWDSGFACIVKDDEVIEITNVSRELLIPLVDYVKKVGKIEIEINKVEDYGDLKIKEGKLRKLGYFINFIKREYQKDDKGLSL